MTRVLAAALFALCALIAVISAPAATADPEDLMPHCSGDQTPTDSNCRPNPGQLFPSGGPGADPELPVGTDPNSEPIA